MIEFLTMASIDRRTTLKLLALSGLTTAWAFAGGDSGQPYTTSWELLDKHRLPEWFEDAKFGMFVDWGLYSIAG